MRLNFTLSLHSDYHVGAGYGLGSQIDSALLRDADNIPVIRGSTIEGLLRDGLWRLLQTPAMADFRKCKRSGLGAAEDRWCRNAPCPICTVFGTPAVSKLWRISSARPHGAGSPLRRTKALSTPQAAAQVNARVRVSPRQRRAEPGKLFQQEEGDARLTFHYSAECVGDQNGAMEQAAWLVAAARMVRRFGAARRRGRGECTLTLDSVLDWPGQAPAGPGWQDHLLGYFESCLNREQVRTHRPATVWEPPQSSAPGSLRFLFLMRIDEPLVTARRAEAGNIFESTNYISGVTLLGALAQEAASRWAPLQDRLYEDFLNAFRREAIRFGCLYPVYEIAGTCYPAIPAPLDLLVCKARREISEHSPPASYARQAVPGECPTCCRHGTSGIPLVPLNDFLAVRPQLGCTQVRHREEMHQEVNPQTQRVATKNLYGYSALESGQYFVTDIWCRDTRTWETLVRLAGLPGQRQTFPLRLGKATRRGYGLVTAWIEPLETDLWLGKALPDRVSDITQPVTLTLLSDTILVDRWGRFRQSFDQSFLEGILGHPVEKDSIRVFCKSGFVDGFNAHLGLPRWRDICLRAGSAVGFRLAANADVAAVQYRMRSAEEEGVGLRRHEGFGCVAFNHPVYDMGNGIQGTGFQMPPALRPGSIAPESQTKSILDDSARLRTFSKDKLDGLAGFRHERWLGVARWLHDSAEREVEELCKGLDELGQPGLLTNVGRDEKKFFGRKNDRDRLKSLLRETSSQTASLRPKFIRKIADAVARCARTENGRGTGE
jgi:CRISPR-associated protein Csx10